MESYLVVVICLSLRYIESVLSSIFCFLCEDFNDNLFGFGHKCLYFDSMYFFNSIYLI